MANRGTPDNTRGTVSPQRLLGSFLATDQLKTVAVPDNASCLLILVDGATLSNRPIVSGNTSFADYPVHPLIAPGGGYSYALWVVSTAEAVDGSLNIFWPNLPGFAWYVISDTAVRAVVATAVGSHAAAMAQDTNGVGYTAGSAPGLSSFDHPPVEYIFQDFNGGSGTVVAAPGAGKRIRLFQAKMTQYTGSAATGASLTIGTQGLLFTGYNAGSSAAPPFTDQVTIPSPGLACPANTPINFSPVTGSSLSIGYVLYTIENV